MRAFPIGTLTTTEQDWGNLQPTRTIKFSFMLVFYFKICSVHGRSYRSHMLTKNHCAHLMPMRI